MEMMEDGKGPKSPKVKGSEGPRYLKVTFKYKLDSKDGPSCNPYSLFAQDSDNIVIN